MTKKIDLTDIITALEPGETIADYVESLAANLKKPRCWLVPRTAKWQRWPSTDLRRASEVCPKAA
jgi:hypothetical protein